MNFLILSGAPNTGKTSIINQLADELLNTKYVGHLNLIIDYSNMNSPSYNLPSFSKNSNGKYNDICVLVEIGTRKVIFHSASDDRQCIDMLAEMLKQHSNVDTVITTCRDIDQPRDERSYMYNKVINPYNSFLLEIPRGRISRTNPNNFSNALLWYETQTLTLCRHNLSQAPYYL